MPIPAGAWPVYVTIALSGMTALAAEVIWTRHLSLLFGATVYTFSLILAVFLLGLGIGSSVGAAIARLLERPRWALGLCQFLLCVAMAWTAYTVTESLPYWPIEPSLTQNLWLNFQLDLFRSMWAVLPAAFLWGASFPLALAAIASRGSGSRTARRRCVRGQHRWRHRWRARRESYTRLLDGQPACTADADRHFRDRRSSDVGAGRRSEAKIPSRRCRRDHRDNRLRDRACLERSSGFGRIHCLRPVSSGAG